MFSRWNQENLFKYMLEHFGLDRLVEHETRPLPETTLVVNPTWRTLDSKVRRAAAELSRAQAAFGAHTPSEPKKANPKSPPVTKKKRSRPERP